MVSVQPESQYASRCLRAGATAYVNKNSRIGRTGAGDQEDT